MSEPTLQDCINYMRSQIKQMEKHPRNYEFNLPYYRKTVELLEKAQRPHGEWIFTGRHNVYGGSEIECSNCHTKLMVSPNRWEIGENFCDVCGSRNKREGDEK